MNDPTELSITELIEKIQRKILSPVDLVGACLQRISKYDGKLHAFTEIYEQDARAAAEAADKAIRSGHTVGPLHGIPIALKDLIDIEGRVTTGGSAVWRERRSKETATLAQKLISAGMIVIGKTHTVEFAFGGWGTNQHLGTPWNPWDMKTHRVPGGSSSGSGVAVAARMVPCAIGTDTGGSVRIPAAWCGISALKTTVGRISTHGVLPLSPSLDTPGPMTRTIADAAILLEVLQGNDPRDIRTLALKNVDPFRDLQRGVKGLRFARIPSQERAGINEEVLNAYDRSIDQFSNMGAEIVELHLPRSFRAYGETSGRIMSAESYAELSEIVDDMSLPVDEAVRFRVRAGASISSREYLRALAEKNQLQHEYHTATEGIDAVIIPVTQTPAILVAEADQVVPPTFLTRWVNFLNLTSVALPNGLCSAGLPLSMQAVCRAGEEALALRIGWSWQDATEWHHLCPPIDG